APTAGSGAEAAGRRSRCGPCRTGRRPPPAGRTSAAARPAPWAACETGARCCPTAGPSDRWDSASVHSCGERYHDRTEARRPVSRRPLSKEIPPRDVDRHSLRGFADSVKHAPRPRKGTRACPLIRLPPNRRVPPKPGRCALRVILSRPAKRSLALNWSRAAKACYPACYGQVWLHPLTLLQCTKLPPQGQVLLMAT